MPVKTVIKLRNGTAAQWTSTNPTLVKGELGIETDTNKFKFGDGTTAWNTLQYAVANASGTSTVDWSAILNKPSTFAPSSHTHPTSEVTGLDTALAGKAASSHSHLTSEVTGLDTSLASKMPINTTNLGNGDFNTYVTSGLYRFDVPTANGPGHSYGQLLVVKGGGADTISQTTWDFLTGAMFTRSDRKSVV